MLIGSQALAAWCPKYRISIKADWDVITTHPEDLGAIDVHRADQYLSHEFFKFAETHPLWPIPVCNLRGLAAIKRSHLALDHNWIKHISCWHVWLKQHYNDEDTPLVKAREKITLEVAKQKPPLLKKSNDAFFNDAVKKVYDHDYLHELVAFHDQPLYTKLKHDHSLAWCEKDLWEALSVQDKLCCVSEEASVISIERFMVPSQWTYPATAAYDKALQKVCTTLTSGWFRDFAIDNHPLLRKMYRPELYPQIKLEIEK